VVAYATNIGFVRCKSLQRLKAETEGFEPSIQLPVYKLSRLARSTTLTSLHLNWMAKIVFLFNNKPIKNQRTSFIMRETISLNEIKRLEALMKNIILDLEIS
jgi:hypothetical protein